MSKHITLILSIMIPVTFSSTPVYAGFENAGYMHTECKKISESNFNFGWCYGFLIGIANTMQYQCDKVKWESKPRDTEFPLRAQTDGVDLENLLSTFIEYTQSRPYLWDVSSWSVATTAFRETFPCEK